MTKPCPFCEIIEGRVEAVVLYEDEQLLVIADHMPLGVGHCLVIPRQHVQDIYELSPKTARHLFETTTHLARVLRESLAFDGLQLIQNNGWAAGQRVFHFHLHLIPVQQGAPPLKLNLSRSRRSLSRLRQEVSSVLQTLSSTSLRKEENPEKEQGNGC